MKYKNKLRNYKQAADIIFNSDSGKEVLAYLKEEYVDPSVLSENSDETMYRLGQKELVQKLIFFVKDEAILDELIVKSYTD
jgi:hypothetical protein